MIKPGDKVRITKGTEKLNKPEHKELFGKILTVQSQPYVGRYAVEEAPDLIFCDWMLETVDEAKTKGKAKAGK